MEADELDYLLPANCPNTYCDTWDRHNSIAFSTAAKGLRNAPGENNCFVNSAVQVFWHLDVFRRSYRRLSGHVCMGNSCIFCALKVIFTQFQFSDQSSLHPDALRKALAETFANQQRFQLGHMDDAAECFENILRRIHYHIANGCNEDNCTAPHCLPHQKFSLNIVEKVVCPCGASSNPLKFSEMVHYISATALVSQARVMQKSGDTLHPDRFGLLLRNANAMGDIRDCPGTCGKTVQIRRTLLNSPDVVSIGLVWDSDHPPVETTTEVAKNIGTSIHMQDVFHSVMQDLHNLPKLQLVGLVCYYGKHYSTFVFHSKLQVWIYFDDATVKEIGPRWEHVVDKCGKGRYQPLLLLYANPNAVPVHVDTAPKKRVMAPGYCIPGAPEEESSLDRSRESISSQQSLHRSRTPNPEPSHARLDQNLSPRARSVTPGASDNSRDDVSRATKSADHSRQQSFLNAMSIKAENKVKHPLRFGGQSGGGGVPGPMMPLSEQQGHRSSLNYSPHPSQLKEEEQFSDYTLSTSDQYRRPSLSGFEPAKLPLTPNMKGYTETQRKDSFKKGKEQIRADVVRYQVDGGRSHSARSLDVQMQGEEYDPNQPPALPPKVGSSMFYQGEGSNHPHLRQRSLSQGGDEAYGSDTGSNYNSQPQHVIVKPITGNQNYDHLDGLSHSHTAVQSGLATLPRRKKDSSHDLSHQKQHSGGAQDIPNAHKSDQKPVSNPKLYNSDEAGKPISSSSDPKGLPPPMPSKYPSSSTNPTGKADSTVGGKKVVDSDKKSKKLKKELKKTEKRKSKSDSLKSLPDLSSIMKPPLPSSSPIPGAGTNDSVKRPEEFKDDKVMYIDRRMVENILKHQGLQRQPSTHSTNSQTSSSSIESDSLMGRLLLSKQNEMGLHTDASFDNVSIGSHKDSGYGSSDRNSSSSTGSGTIDPYTQYFISKSMVVPRNLNSQLLDRPPQQLVSDFTAPNPQVYTASMGSSGGQGKDLSGLSKEEMSRHLYETLTQRKVMHPIKESSQEDILRIFPKEQTPSSTPVRSPSPLPTNDGLSKEGRPPPIPPKNFAAFQVSKSAHHREPSIDSLDKDEVENGYFVSMCEKADELMDKCILAETQGDLSSALCYCDSALGCLKEAMNQTDISNKALVYAQKKHNSCLLKSRSLFKKTSNHGSSDGTVQGGKRSSITSTDSDNSDRPARTVGTKERLLPPGRSSNRPGPQQPSTSAAASHLNPARHQLQNSTASSSSSIRKSPLPTSQPIPAPGRQRNSQPSSHAYPPSYTLSGQQGAATTTSREAVPLQSRVSRSSATDRMDSESTHSRSASNSSMRSSASIPCSMSQTPVQTMVKSQSSNGSELSQATPNTPMPLDKYGTLPRNRKPRRTSDPTGNSEVYQMYLNRQKTVQGGSGSDSRESDSSSCDGNLQKKMYQSELKELKGTNVVQRQTLQLSENSDSNAGPAAMNQRQFVDSKPSSGSRLGFNSDRQRFSGDTSTGLTYSPYPNQQNSNIPEKHQAVKQLNRPPVSSPAVPSPANTQSVQHHISSNSSTGVGSVQLSHSGASQAQHSYISQSSPYPTPMSQQPTATTPSPHSVSGYSQPLPGHRGSSSQGGPVANSAYNASSYQPDPLVKPSYPQQYTQNQGNPQYRTNNSQEAFSPASSSQANNSSPRTLQNNVQSLSQSVQNFNINPSSNQTMRINSGKGSGGPPPPPPARTTSNPDFKQQQQQQHVNYQQQQQHQHQAQPQAFWSARPEHQGANLEVRSSKQRIPSVALVQPNSHLNMGQFQTSFASRNPPVANTGTGFMLGSQLKHATSTTGLNNLALGPRPLERCSSQPDCQNLVDSASYSNQPDVSSSISTPSNPSSYSNSNKTGNNFPVGPSMTLPQTSELFSTHGCTYPNQDTCPSRSKSLDDSSDDGDLRPKPSVRALASRFDRAAEKPQLKPKPNSSGIQRTRSKSESGKKPKSVLKNKKPKAGTGRPRKSVTFASDFSEMAAGYESAAELTSFSTHSMNNDRAYYSDEEHFVSKPSLFSDNDVDDTEGSSNSDDFPTPREELACQLCHKREIEVGKGYCSKCSFYLNRLVSS